MRSDVFSPPFLLRLLRIWALELRSPVAFAPMTNGLCCMYFPHGGFIATGYVCVRGEQRDTWLLTTFPASLGLQAGFLGWGMPVPAASSGYMGIIEPACVPLALCSLLWVLLQDQGWPRPVLDRSKGPLITEALVPQGSAHLPHNIPGPGAPYSQEAEGIPHLPDLLKQDAMWMHGGESPLPGGRAWPGLEEAPHDDVTLMPEPWGRIAAALLLRLPRGVWRGFLV